MINSRLGTVRTVLCFEDPKASDSVTAAMETIKIVLLLYACLIGAAVSQEVELNGECIPPTQSAAHLIVTTSIVKNSTAASIAETLPTSVLIYCSSPNICVRKFSNF